MKKFLLIFSLPFSILLLSQELDETYLKSLPESVQKDVLNKIDAKEKLEEPVYRRASTSVDKEINDEEVDERNIRFGSIFFDTFQTSFMPINEPNLDTSYTLDFGDIVEIQLIGQKDTIDTYDIKRDGSINIPDIGKITLAGLTIADADDFVKAKVKSIYINTDSYLTLKNIRDISVLIAGNAFNPGIYTLNGNSNILHALNMAGGIDEIGSYRDINLIRNGEIIDTLDIYEVLIYGKHQLNKGLRSGDSIVVNPLTNTVSVESGVLRPGKYELNDDETLADLIKYGNGLKSNIDKKNIILKRVKGNLVSNIPIDINELDSIKIQDGDSLYIREFKVDTLLIEGLVMNPGYYQVPRGTTLSEAILIAGGYDDKAYPFGGYLENKKALKVNETAKQKLYDTFLNNLITNSSTLQGEVANLGLVLDQIKNAEVTGRVIAEFDLDVLKANPALDTVLEDQDRLIIPGVTQQVYIHGEVSNPGATRYSPNKDISYYIDNAGGALNKADLSSIFIVHPNGETENIKLQTRLSFIDNDLNNQLIYPGSIIYIPKSSNFANSLETASVWAPIISSVA